MSIEINTTYNLKRGIQNAKLQNVKRFIEFDVSHKKVTICQKRRQPLAGGRSVLPTVANLHSSVYLLVLVIAGC